MIENNYKTYSHILEQETKAFIEYTEKLKIEQKDIEEQIKEASMFVAFNLLIEISFIQLKLNKIEHLSTEHFVYSSLEAFKNLIEDTGTFPHTEETNVQFIDKRLALLFEKAYKNYMLSSTLSDKVYRSITIEY